MNQILGDSCQLATRIPKALHRAVKVAALEDGVPVQDWVSDALAAYLAGLEGKPAPAPLRDSAPRRHPPMARRMRVPA